MFVDKIIIINLDRAIERKQKILDSIIQSSISLDKIVFLPAIDEQYLTDDLDRTLFGKNMRRTFSKGEICCTLSHIFALKFSKIHGFKNVLILEDDIKLCEDFLIRLDYLKNQLPLDWMQVYLGGTFNSLGKKVTDNLYEVGETLCGTYSYILNEKSYDLIINKLMSFSTATDGEFDELRSNKELKSYIFLPLFTYQQDNYSFINKKNRPQVSEETKKNYAEKIDRLS